MAAIFGSGIGILMIGALSFISRGDIRHVVALKNFLTLCMRGVAVLVLVLEGDVNWNYGGPMAIGGLVGGYVGGRYRIAQIVKLFASSLSRLVLLRQAIISGSSTAQWWFGQAPNRHHSRRSKGQLTARVGRARSGVFLNLGRGPEL